MVFMKLILVSRFHQSLALFIQREQVLEDISANASKSITFSLLEEWKSPSWQLSGSRRVSTLFKSSHACEKHNLIKLLKKHHQTHGQKERFNLLHPQTLRKVVRDGTSEGQSMLCRSFPPSSKKVLSTIALVFSAGSLTDFTLVRGTLLPFQPPTTQVAIEWNRYQGNMQVGEDKKPPTPNPYSNTQGHCHQILNIKMYL